MLSFKNVGNTIIENSQLLKHIRIISHNKIRFKKMMITSKIEISRNTNA